MKLHVNDFVKIHNSSFCGRIVECRGKLGPTEIYRVAIGQTLEMHGLKIILDEISYIEVREDQIEKGEEDFLEIILRLKKVLAELSGINN